VRSTQTTAAIRMLVLLTVVLGLAYPLAVTGVAQVAFPDRADGSLVEVDGSVVGSELVGQPFEDSAGLFAARPSALDQTALEVGPVSGASHEGPESETLADVVRERRAEVAEREGVAPASVPVDALTAGASGLDPHISPEYAALQVARVARENDLPADAVRRLVADATEGRTLGVLGEARVNVLLLNVAVTEAAEDAGPPTSRAD
jgi:K+-transporting ATPase ATPase C chain